MACALRCAGGSVADRWAARVRARASHDDAAPYPAGIMTAPGLWRFSEQWTEGNVLCGSVVRAIHPEDVPVSETTTSLEESAEAPLWSACWSCWRRSGRFGRSVRTVGAWRWCSAACSRRTAHHQPTAADAGGDRAGLERLVSVVQRAAGRSRGAERGTGPETLTEIPAEGLYVVAVDGCRCRAGACGCLGRAG